MFIDVELVEGLDISSNAARRPVGNYGMSKVVGDKLYIEPQHKNRISNLSSQRSNSGHPNFLSGVMVWLSIEAPHNFWNQWQRYHFQQIISSESKMYMVTKMSTSDRASKYTNRVSKRTIDMVEWLVGRYNEKDIDFEDLTVEVELKWGIECEIYTKRELFEVIVENMPLGYQLTASVVTNYLQLRTMYEQRKNHRLSSWNDEFVRMINSLPESWLITGEE